jgi:hypothetical protein
MVSWLELLEAATDAGTRNAVYLGVVVFLSETVPPIGLDSFDNKKAPSVNLPDAPSGQSPHWPLSPFCPASSPYRLHSLKKILLGRDSKRSAKSVRAIPKERLVPD